MNSKDEEIFKIFEGDFTSLALYVYISSLLKTNERQLIALKEFYSKTGFGRNRLLKSFDQLQKFNLISYEIIHGIGVSVLRKSNCEFRFQNSAVQDESICDYKKNNCDYLLYKEIQKHNLEFQKHNCLTTSEVADINEQREFIRTYQDQDLKQSLNLKLKLSSKTKTKLIPKPKTKLKSKTKSKSLVPAKRKPKSLKPKTLGARIWDSYAEAYEERYGFKPATSAASYSNTAQIGQRVGEEGPDIVRYYVNHSDKFFTQNRHAIRFALSNIDRLRADRILGMNISSQDAKAFEDNKRTEDLIDLIAKQIAAEKMKAGEKT